MNRPGRSIPRLAAIAPTRAIALFLGAAVTVALPPVAMLFAAALPATADVREVGQLVFDGIPEIPARIVEKTLQYQNVRPATFADWAPGGGLLILTTFADARRCTAWPCPAARAGN
jgi:hypothetical protein